MHLASFGRNGSKNIHHHHILSSITSVLIDNDYNKDLCPSAGGRTMRCRIRRAVTAPMTTVMTRIGPVSAEWSGERLRVLRPVQAPADAACTRGGKL